MKELMEVLKFDGRNVRMVEVGFEPWWVLKDVCEAIEVQNHRDVAQKLDEDEKGVARIYTPGGEQEMLIVNEPGLWQVILRSDKPAAKKFKRWLTHEVLPKLRRTGKYVSPWRKEFNKQLKKWGESAQIYGIMVSEKPEAADEVRRQLFDDLQEIFDNAPGMGAK